jgi:epoxyqueuosine reductase QueG
MKEELKGILKNNNAQEIGFSALHPSLVRGLDESYKTAISILSLLNASEIKKISNGPNHVYEADYERLNSLLTNQCHITVDYLKKAGYKAESIEHIIGSLDKTAKDTVNPHKTFAANAGMGWIGKSSLLVNKEYGSAFRIATVVTNAKIEPDNHVYKNYCGSCMVCRDTCPADAINGITCQRGITTRDQLFNAQKCFNKIVEYMTLLDTDSPICGICMRTCPWTEHYLKRIS